MLARIEQVTTTPDGALALFATYWQDGQQVSAWRHKVNMPLQVLAPYRNANGLRERLDGVEVADEPSEVDAILAAQIGTKTVVVEVAGAVIAERAVVKVASFAVAYRRAAVLRAQAEAATEEQLLAMAAGRAQWLSQVVEAAAANRDADTLQGATQRLSLAQQAMGDAGLARQLAEAEIAPLVAVLDPETPWPAGSSDPRGFLKPEVLALVGTEWEC